jgi:hypothetical protein
VTRTIIDEGVQLSNFEDSKSTPRVADPDREDRVRDAESLQTLKTLVERAGADIPTVRLAREDIAALASAIAQALHEKFRSPNFQFDVLYRLPYSEDSARYVAANMRNAMKVAGKDNHLRHVFGKVGEGLLLEFGVFKGHSINVIASAFGDRQVHGFDSFEGLPADWPGYNVRASAFDQGGKLPRVAANVILHKGWFDQSLPEFLRDTPGEIAFIHVDCDIYESTKTIFDVAGDRIRPGTVIAFDEYHNYPGWREHEHRALQEFCTQRDVRYEYISYNNLQAAVRITEIGDRRG